jgi:HK97 family phage portal protein
MILERIFGATLDDPQFTLQDQMAADLFGGVASETGVRVNAQTANTYSPWYRGISLISRDCAKLPIYVYRKIEADAEGVGGGKEKFTDHQSYAILRRKTNPIMTAFHFKMLLTSHAMTSGNGYGYIVRAGDGLVLPVSDGGGIFPMDPRSTYPVRETIENDATGSLISSRLWYVTQVNGQQRKIDAEDVLHIKGVGFDGLVGYDVVSMATNTIGRGMAHQKFANKFFSNGMHLKVVLETPNVIQPEVGRQIIDSWNRMQGGLENAHRTAILHSGLKANSLTSTARDAQFIEGEEFNIRFIADFLGIPPHKLGAKTGESYASKEQENLDYLFQALDFWLSAWEDECWDKLLTESEKEGEEVHVEFSREKLFEADLNTKATYWRTALAGQPWAKVNEARSSFNMNPVPGGDEILTPLNMGSGASGVATSGNDDEEFAAPDQPEEPEDDGAGEEEDDSAEEEKTSALRAAIKTNLEEAVRRVVRRIGHDATKAATKPATFCDWLEKVPEAHGNIAREMVHSPMQAASVIMASGAYDSGMVLRAVCDRLLDFTGRVTAKTLAAELPAEMARLETEIPAKVSALFFGE